MPLFWLSLAFLLGIAAAPHLNLPSGAWLALAGLFLSLPFLLRLSRSRFHFPLPSWAGHAIERVHDHLPGIPLLLLPVLFTLGGARYTFSLPVIDARHVAYYNDNGRLVILQAILVEPPDERDGFSFLKFQAESLQYSDETEAIRLDGLVQVRTTEISKWRYGDLLLLKGQLVTPSEEEDFSYRAYLSRRGVHSLMDLESAERVASGQGSRIKAVFYSFKAEALDTIYRHSL